MFKGFGKIFIGCALAASILLTGCDLVREDSDCVASYNVVKFVYDHNMKFADAFDHEVKRVMLFAFDHESGRLVKRIRTLSDNLDADNGMVLDVKPGDYDLLVWAGDYDDSFLIAEGEEGVSTLSDFHAYMRREQESGSAHVRRELASLYHGLVSVSLPYASPSRPNHITVPLKKDTNSVRVVLQQISGDPVNADDFNFYITDANGWLNSDNTLRGTETITYHPIHIKTGSVDINTNPEDIHVPGSNPASGRGVIGTRSALTAALAEFSVGRLTTEADPILLITRRDGSTVLSVNIRDYALLVMGQSNRAMSPQEYLDRQDEYNMTFFLDGDSRWLSTIVVINDWRIIFNEGELGG